MAGRVGAFSLAFRGRRRRPADWTTVLPVQKAVPARDEDQALDIDHVAHRQGPTPPFAHVASGEGRGAPHRQTSGAADGTRTEDLLELLEMPLPDEGRRLRIGGKAEERAEGQDRGHWSLGCSGLVELRRRPREGGKPLLGARDHVSEAAERMPKRFGISRRPLPEPVAVSPDGEVDGQPLLERGLDGRKPVAPVARADERHSKLLGDLDLPLTFFGVEGRLGAGTRGVRQELLPHPCAVYVHGSATRLIACLTAPTRARVSTPVRSRRGTRRGSSSRW